MPQRWRNILLSILAAPLLFTSCKKQFSSDAALTPIYTPSIIINSDNQVVYGIDPSTGLKNWQYSLPSTFGTLAITFAPSPLVYGGMVYMASVSSDTLYKINSRTGAGVAKFKFVPATTTFKVQSTPIAFNKLIFVSGSNNTIYAVDTSTGISQWKYTAPGAGSLISSPVIYKDTLYGATTSGTIFAVATTQAPATVGGAVTAAWTCTKAGASFYSSPAVSAPFLYIGSVTDSNMYCLPLQTTGGGATNTIRWSYKTHGSIYSSPAVNYGKCVFGSSDFNVYCLDTTLSAIAVGYSDWIRPTTSSVWSSPMLVNGVAYIDSFDYNLYAINMVDGNVKWTFKTNALVKSSPLVYGSTVFIASYDKNLYAVDTTLGTLKWSYNTNGEIQCSPAIEDLSSLDQINSQISGYTNF